MIARMVDEESATDPALPVPARSSRRPRATRDDWRQWLPEGVPEPSTITRAELLVEVQRWGVAVSERELRYWESLGALPHPVRKFQNGATHATYPLWYDEIVTEAVVLRGQGLDWSAIGQRLRGTFADIASRAIHARWKPDFRSPSLTPDVFIAIQRFMAEMNRGRNEDEKIMSADLVLITRSVQRIEFDILAPQEAEAE